ncbi:MAG: hypothetical protein KKB13_04170 [Chloroflexi bacterium]|nr:hypothetical protein [Chloroflexota bacterium]
MCEPDPYYYQGLAAQQLHRPGTRSFGLPAEQVGRQPRHGQPCEYTLDLRTDEVRWGARVVWKAGARQEALLIGNLGADSVLQQAAEAT